MEHPILFLLHFFESWLIAYAGGVIYKFSSRPPKLFLLIGLFNGIFVYFLRSIFIILKLKLGLHTFIVMAFFTFLCKNILNISWLKAVYSSLTVFVILNINEVLIASVFMRLLNWTFVEIMNNPYKQIIIGIVDATPFILILLFGAYKNRKEKGNGLNKFGSSIYYK